MFSIHSTEPPSDQISEEKNFRSGTGCCLLLDSSGTSVVDPDLLDLYQFPGFVFVSELLLYLNPDPYKKTLNLIILIHFFKRKLIKLLKVVLLLLAEKTSALLKKTLRIFPCKVSPIILGSVAFS